MTVEVPIRSAHSYVYNIYCYVVYYIIRTG